MVQIVEGHHQYVPQVEVMEEVFLPEINQTITVHKATTHNIMLGGDQLTKVRATSALKIKANAEKPSTRLEGIIPTLEDWHAKQTLLEVSNRLIHTCYIYTVHACVNFVYYM